MAALFSPGSGPCLPQGIPEVYLFGCQVSSQEIGGIFRKQWAEDRPGQLGATTAIDDLGHTQTTRRGENLQRSKCQTRDTQRSRNQRQGWSLDQLSHLKKHQPN